MLHLKESKSDAKKLWDTEKKWDHKKQDRVMDKQSLGVVVGEYRGIIQSVPWCLCGPHTRMPARGHTHTQLTYNGAATHTQAALSFCAIQKIIKLFLAHVIFIIYCFTIQWNFYTYTLLYFTCIIRSFQG